MDKTQEEPTGWLDAAQVPHCSEGRIQVQLHSLFHDQAACHKGGVGGQHKCDGLEPGTPSTRVG